MQVKEGNTGGGTLLDLHRIFKRNSEEEKREDATSCGNPIVKRRGRPFSPASEPGEGTFKGKHRGTRPQAKGQGDTAGKILKKAAPGAVGEETRKDPATHREGRSKAAMYGQRPPRIA